MKTKLSLNKKGQALNGLYAGMLVLATIGILAAILLYVLTQIATNFTAASSAYNAVTSLIGYIVAFLPWIGIIFTVLGASVVLNYVITSFRGGRGA
ncbi:hypothetical protein C0585_01025 [Candidatus Woesearchaeota archaeon]|uniref:hypothetical protein n=1 Tax=uncultured Arcobacter sp. TaxID=165434 RepID=UPI000CB9F3B0|nr:hypothetical protein [uncultured Arcobacter sp.]PLW80766.1 MAG: hypothetical protein C0585_01025 [Candidatus Woesearchaeota archaeon]